jgi:hypothetical protein
MRDKNLLQFKDFDSKVEEFIKKRIPEKILVLRKLILDNPNFLNLFENNLRIFSKKTDVLLSLTIISWYLPKEIGILLLLELEEKQKFLNEKDLILFRIFSTSKEVMLSFLFLTNKWHSRDLFGNILRNGLRELENLRFKRRIFKEIPRKERKRGYQDHGSRRPDFKWLPSSDYSFTLIQNSKEKKKLKLQAKYQRILKFLENFLQKEKDSRNT